MSLINPSAQSAVSDNGVSCIFLFLVGGPSQLDTWDLKPDAPSIIRGPFRPIRTNVPGIEICEHFPLMAKMADRFAIVRSVHHEEAAIHETGQQMLQTGRFAVDSNYPHCGAVVSYLRGQRSVGLPANIVLPGPIGDTGAAFGHGQTASFLGTEHEPLVALHQSGSMIHRAFDIGSEPEPCRRQYGRHHFGQSCLLARRLVEHGVQFVTVNMFQTVFNRTTWDCHADGGRLDTCLGDYQETLCPMFDQAFSALLEDLKQRGRLANTLVVAAGEFGRTPKLNARGGRDHWPGVWSVLFAGGGVRGGQAIGSSDHLGAEPRDRPVRPAELTATIYRALGIDQTTRLTTPDGSTFPLVDAEPVFELF
jgi:hypothetical protein